MIARALTGSRGDCARTDRFSLSNLTNAMIRAQLKRFQYGCHVLPVVTAAMIDD